MYLGFGCILCDGEFVYCVWVRVPSASFLWPFFLCEAVPLIYCHLHPSNYLDNGVIEFWCETQQNQDSYGNLVFSRTLGKLTEENIKFNGVTGSSFSFVYWLCYCVHGILTENGYQVGNDLACGSVFDVLDWDQYFHNRCKAILSWDNVNLAIWRPRVPWPDPSIQFVVMCPWQILAHGFVSGWNWLKIALLQVFWNGRSKKKFFIGEINI